MFKQHFQQPPIPSMELLNRYDMSCPRYTSYPTAAELDDYSDLHYLYNFKSVREKPFEPLSLYIHIPFCQDICYYCACNKIVTKKPDIAMKYLRYLDQEMQMIQGEIGKRRVVKQLHIGGGTPTFLDGGQLTLLMMRLASHFRLSDEPSREYSIEIDPRTITKDTLALLKGLGFNRVSFGVQDFSPDVQEAINRRHSVEDIDSLVKEAKDQGFQSVNMDLLYGLPLQTEISFAQTLQSVINIKPDRIALYNYAHLPSRFKAQKQLDKYPMPDAKEKSRLYKMAIETLSNACYEMIGMDHFVLPEDELFTAKRHNKLQRNFQGYSVRKAGDLIGLGVSAISQGDRFIHQNSKDLDDYYNALDQQRLPIEKGLYVDDDDLKHRFVIMPLMTLSKVDIPGWEAAFNDSFRRYFATNLANLQSFIDDGLITLSEDSLRITDKGQLFVRQIASQFDAYRKNSQTGFSKAL